MWYRIGDFFTRRKYVEFKNFHHFPLVRSITLNTTSPQQLKVSLQTSAITQEKLFFIVKQFNSSLKFTFEYAKKPPVLALTYAGKKRLFDKVKFPTAQISVVIDNSLQASEFISLSKYINYSHDYSEFNDSLIEDLEEIIRTIFHKMEIKRFRHQIKEVYSFPAYNSGKGVDLKTRMLLERTANAIRGGEFIPENTLGYIDTLTLYSNHADQQIVGEKPSEADKQKFVLNLLEAAFQISPKYDYVHLEKYSTRELSSHAQLLHYLGRARRYAGISAEERLPMLSTALSIANYLSLQNLDELADPHNYDDRTPTYTLPIVYCLQDLKRFDEAIEILKPQLQLASAFHRTQAHIQIAQTYLKNSASDVAAFEHAIQHAKEAIDTSLLDINLVIKYNARVCLMQCLQAADRKPDAIEIAEKIIEEIHADPDCGGKPVHLKAAETVMEANRSPSLRS